MIRRDLTYMAYFDSIVDVLESHNSTALGLCRDCGLRREKMLQNLDDSLTKRGCEALKDQVWIALRDSSTQGVGNIESEHHIV